MAFNVEISPRAFGDLDELATNIKQRSRSYAVARKWLLSVLESIDSLAEMPERCPVVIEAEIDVERVRVLLHGARSEVQDLLLCAEGEPPRLERSACSRAALGSATR